MRRQAGAYGELAERMFLHGLATPAHPHHNDLLALVQIDNVLRAVESLS